MRERIGRHEAVDGHIRIPAARSAGSIGIRAGHGQDRLYLLHGLGCWEEQRVLRVGKVSCGFVESLRQSTLGLAEAGHGREHVAAIAVGGACWLAGHGGMKRSGDENYYASLHYQLGPPIIGSTCTKYQLVCTSYSSMSQRTFPLESREGTPFFRYPKNTHTCTHHVHKSNLFCAASRPPSPARRESVTKF